MRPLIFLNSHPIQYFAPLYKEITETTTIDLTVWYCSDESIAGKFDKGFGTEVKWNIPLLEGYSYKFFKNYSWKKSISNGFFGLMNLGILKQLFKQKKSVIIIHGWNYVTHVMVIIFGKLFGHTICLRAETPLNQELLKNKVHLFLKNIYLKFLFVFIDKYLYIGEQNKLFYKSLSVKEEKLIFVPYAVDNKRFQNIYQSVSVMEARTHLRLPADKKIILFSGKYISKKRPMDLLEAFSKMESEKVILVFVGEGELRKSMQEFIDLNHLSGKVILTGFVNQHEIPLYYRAANIFVMCSGAGETWGLSVNEAMNFGLPVIISETCGSSHDLIDENKNGNVYKTGDIKELNDLLVKYVNLPEQEMYNVIKTSLSKIEKYSYNRIIHQLQSLVS